MAVALEIVSPEKLLLSRPVDMVVIPGSEGDIGVLEGHTPMIVTLRGGTIDLYEGDKLRKVALARLITEAVRHNQAKVKARKAGATRAAPRP